MNFNSVNGPVRLSGETFGRTGDEPLLLISGTGVQMLIWPEEFCTALTGRGFQVARFDNRDTGRSSHLDGVAAPGWVRALLRPSSAPYTLTDLAGDAFAVMDTLGWDSAHVVGASMGGMIAQIMACTRPGRVRTLTSLMSTPSSRIGTMPRLPVMKRIMEISGTPATSAAEAGEQLVALKSAMTTAAYPLDTDLVRDIGRRSFERAPDDEAADERQRAAIIASGDRRAQLRQLAVPTLVLHGEDDPVIRVKGGRATAAAIPGARLVTFPGLGHDLPRALWPRFVDEIAALAGLGSMATDRSGSEKRGPATGH